MKESKLFPEITWKTAKLGEICKISSGGSIKKDEYKQDGKYPVTIGTIHKADKAWISDNTLILDIINSSINYDLLYYALMNMDFKSITTGNAQPLITQGRLKEQIIRYPESIEDQQKIAKLLSGLDELRKLHTYQIDILTKLTSQLMSDVFP